MFWLSSHLASFALIAASIWLAGTALVPFDRKTDLGLGPLRSVARWCAGLAVWGVALFVLAAAGRFEPQVLLVLSIVVPLAVLREGKRLTWSEVLGRVRFERRTLMTVAGFGVLIAPLWLLANSPTVSWDASSYHLTLPQLYLESGGFRPVELNVYSHWPLGTELLFAVALAIHDAAAAKLIHLGFGLLVLVTLVAGCRAFVPEEHRALASGLAVLLFLANGVVLFEMSIAYVDLAHAFYFTSALLLLLRWVELRQTDDRPHERLGRRRLLVLAGVAAGLAAGTKLSGLAGVVLLLAVAALAVARGKQPRQDTGTLAVGFVGVALALWALWPVRSFLATGNPVYPALFGLFGGPDWNGELAARLAEWQHSIGMGRSPLDYLLLPWRVAMEGGRGYSSFDGTSTPLWLLAFPAALWRARHDAFVRRCLAAGGLYFGFWALTSQQMRLLIPAFPPLALAAAAGNAAWLHGLGERLGQRSRRLAVGAAVAVALGAVAWQLPWRGSLAVLGRLVQQPAPVIAASAVPPVFSFVNSELPADARLLMLNTNQRYFCERDALADSFFEASQIAAWLAPAGHDPATLRRLLAERGVTHLLLDQRPLGVVYPPALESFLRDPAQARPLYQSPEGRFVVFALAAMGPGVVE